MTGNHFNILLGRSKWLLAYLILIHGLMLVILLMLLANILWSLLAISIILASFFYYSGRYQWLASGQAIIKIERNDKQQWKLCYSDSTSQEKLVLKHCVVTSKLVILYFSGSSVWRDKSVTILEDAVDSELFRQLRVYCRGPKIFQK